MSIRFHLAHDTSFGDLRLEKRHRLIQARLGSEVSGSIPSRLMVKKEIKGYYRFINNEKITPDRLVMNHRHKSMERALNHRGLLLSIQDTTCLDYTGKRASKQLGSMSYEHQKGFYLHNHLLLDTSGVPLGLFSQQFFAHEPTTLAQEKKRYGRAYEKKESYRWLVEFEALQDAFAKQSQNDVLCICDREADIHEVLQARKHEHVHFLIRSRDNRKIDGQDQYIHEHVAQGPPATTYTLKLPASNGRKARKAKVEVRYTTVTIHAGYRPKGQKQLQPVTLNIIEAREVDVPEGINKPLHWRLLTSMPVPDTQSALDMIGYYTIRWVIERFHFVLKQGMEVEERQIESPQALKNAVILDSWAATQLCALHYLARVKPHLPTATTALQVQNIAFILVFLAQHHRITLTEIDPEALTIEQFHRIIAILGGFQNQKNKTPGIVSLWIGWKKYLFLTDILQTQKDVGNQ
jgi:hypothetical protein